MMMVAAPVVPLLAAVAAAAVTPNTQLVIDPWALLQQSVVHTGKVEQLDPHGHGVRHRANKAASLGCRDKSCVEAKRLPPAVTDSKSEAHTEELDYTHGERDGLLQRAVGQLQDEVWRGSRPRRKSNLVLFLTIAVTCVAIIALLAFFGARLLSKAIKGAIENFDQKAIGVDVDFESLLVSICRGRIDMEGCNVHNFPGYTAKYMLHITHLSINIKMKKLLSSFGKEVEIDSIELHNVDCILEYDGMLPFTGTSNFQRMLDHLGGDDAKPSIKQTQKVEQGKGAEEEKKPGQGKPREVRVHKVSICDVGAKLASKIGGIRAAVADIKYTDFSKEVGAHYMDDVIWAVLKSVTKSVITNITGKHFADKVM